MKTKRSLSSVALIAVASLSMSAASFAQNNKNVKGHSGAGNGDGSPKIAYSDEELAKVKLDFSLDYLKLTPQQIQERDKKLAPIYKYYQDATASRVAQALEATYGLSVYHFNNTAEPSLKDKKSTMDSIVRFYTGKRGAFEKADPKVVPGAGMLRSWQGSVHMDLIKGNKKDWKVEYDDYNGFLLQTIAKRETEYHEPSLWWDYETTKHALYTSVNQKLFSVPVMESFMSSMKDSGLRGLDATIVFLGGNMQNCVKVNSERSYYGETKCTDVPYQAVYPQNGKLAPIPQPVIFISKDATAADLAEMIDKEAPLVYAYNQLFMTNMLPSAQEIDAIVAKYPEFTAEIEKAKGKVGKDILRSKLHSAFIKVSYGLLTAGIAPVALAAAIASPILAPVIITQVIVIL